MTSTCHACEWKWERDAKHFWRCPNCGGVARLPTTQKARGIVALRDAGTLTVPAVYGLVGANEVIPEGVTFPSCNPLFARPCPPNPEHGFVESRTIKGIEELRKLQAETLAANPDSEVILMQRVNAHSNFIWTPSLLTIGRGHDGATSGKDTLSIPLSGQNPIHPALMTLAGISKWPYVEGVTEQNVYWTTYLVQLRNGPVLESVTLDYIPGEIKVTSVVQTNGEDLLEWAKRVKAIEAANAAGESVVVYHPGGSLTDHYTVHCREHGVPIMLSMEPQVGDILIGAELPEHDIDAMKLGVLAGSLYDGGNGAQQANAVHLALLALHNSGKMRGPYSFWIGVATSLIIKLGSAALQGEARHAHGAKSSVRSNLYDFYIPKSLTFHRARLSRVTQLLTYGFGDPTTPHSFGGPKWGLCGAALAPLFNAVRDLFIYGSSTAARDMVTSLNVAVNQAHNGGWWLNKFAQKIAYDEIPKGNLNYVTSVVNTALDIWDLRSKAAGKLEDFSKDVSAWPVTKIEPLKWRKVSLDVTPGAFIINLKAATIPVPLQITIPVNAATIGSLLNKTCKLEVDDSAGVVNFLSPDAPPVEVWKEYPLDPTQTKVTN